MNKKEKIKECIRELEDMPIEIIESLFSDTTFKTEIDDFGHKEQTLFIAGIEKGLEMALNIINRGTK